jgi:hypothetical protein
MIRRPRKVVSRKLASASLVALTGVGLSLVPLNSTPAYASNWGSICDNATDCVSMANNATHSIRFGNLTSADSATAPNGIPRMQAAANYAIARYDATDMRVYRDENDSVPDVWISDYDYGETPWVAIARCPTNNTGTGGSHPNRWCRGQQNIHNAWYYWHDSGYFDTDWQRQVVTCHELGHTVGLRHNTTYRDSCMWTAVWESTKNGLHAHDIAHINAKY